MSVMTEIPAKKVESAIKGDKPLNVVAYCRVSTDKEDQKSSLKAQKEFFELYFSENKNWNNLGIYKDEGISGTSLKNRNEFNRMIQIAKSPSHPIDYIITKEVSRFSRNIKDTLSIVQELREINVFVYFITNEIDTAKDDYLSVLSAISLNAQQESIATSNRVRFGQELRMKAGVVFGTKNMYGYNIVKDEFGKQHFEIIEEEAEVVRKVFEWYNEGIGTHRIAKKLEQMGIKSKYKNGWSNTVILRLLKQEKYVGDLCLGKTYTKKDLTHRKYYNNGESKKFYHKDHHPEQAIISRELWDSVQKKLEENSPSEETKKKHNNRYWLSGKVFCGICEERFIRLTKQQKSGNIYVAWDCIRHQHRGTKRTITTDSGEKIEVGCNSKQVNERVLRQAVIDILNQIIIPQKETIIKQVEEYIINTSKNRSNHVEKIDKAAIEEEISELTKMKQKALHYLLKDVITEQEYQTTSKEIEQNIFSLTEKLQENENALSDELRKKDEIEKYISQINRLFDTFVSGQDHEGYSDYQEELLYKVTKKIIVHPDKILEIYLTAIPFPIYLQYNTTGRGENYSVEFTIINRLPE
ncbi:MAG: recombinase family protein [Clostridiaceae bacterium]|nr:recombinase family protein [Clostridiaceae bacterium]